MKAFKSAVLTALILTLFGVIGYAITTYSNILIAAVSGVLFSIIVVLIYSVVYDKLSSK